MGLPSNPDAPENKASNTADTVNRDPSYPDRARIDSDVRAFLRPVSTPWIVFDRDSRVDDFAKSALRVGAVFASSPSFRPEVIKAAEEIGKPVSEVAAMSLPLAPLEQPSAGEPLVREDVFRAGAVLAPAMSSVVTEPGMFPASASSPESVVEPSNLVVASDVMRDSSSIVIHDDVRSAVEADPFATPSLVAVAPKRGRFAALAGACAGVLALVGVTAVVLSGATRLHAKASTTAPAVQLAAAMPAAAAMPVAPVETTELDAIPASPPPAKTAEAAAERAPEPAAPKIPTDPKKRFGKLTIKSDAKYKNVWFDGKRMLGTGQRSFLVFCGMHTIAVADKADARDVEVPCNGEYVVSK